METQSPINGLTSAMALMKEQMSAFAFDVDPSGSSAVTAAYASSPE